VNRTLRHRFLPWRCMVLAGSGLPRSGKAWKAVHGRWLGERGFGQAWQVRSGQRPGPERRGPVRQAVAGHSRRLPRGGSGNGSAWMAKARIGAPSQGEARSRVARTGLACIGGAGHGVGLVRIGMA
jgi:hypothetical protein